MRWMQKSKPCVEIDHEKGEINVTQFEYNSDKINNIKSFKFEPGSVFDTNSSQKQIWENENEKIRIQSHTVTRKKS